MLFFFFFQINGILARKWEMEAQVLNLTLVYGPGICCFGFSGLAHQNLNSFLSSLFSVFLGKINRSLQHALSSVKLESD